MSTPIFSHEAANSQIGKAHQLAARLGMPGFAIKSSHTSKGILLPVPTLSIEGLSFTFRDNFHDLNLLVKSDREINMRLDFFYTPQSLDWYKENIDRNRNYSFRDWTDEEISDPRILRVQRKNGSWKEIEGDEKGRWNERMTSTAWYCNDWSGGELLYSGPCPFAEETLFYPAPNAYAEGISSHAKTYMGPCKEFLNYVNDWQELERLCIGIKNAYSTSHPA